MDWTFAHAWAKDANRDKSEKCAEPNWSWDCGFKLDYDGGLLRVSSRFYCIDDTEDIFEGSVSIYFGDTLLNRHDFSARHLNILKNDVEKHVESVKSDLKHLCSTLFLSNKTQINSSQ